MVNKCCVPRCKGNYRNGPKVHVFRFPTSVEERRKWLSAIHRQDFEPTVNSRVCHLHFRDEDLQWESTFYEKETGNFQKVPLNAPRLHPLAVPSIFPGCPSYMTTETCIRESPDEKRQRIEAASVRKAIEESLQSHADYESAHSFGNFKEFKECIQKHCISSYWDIVYKDKRVLFIHMDIEVVPKLKCSVLINEESQVSVFYGAVTLKPHSDSYTFPRTVCNINEVQELLSCIENLGEKSSTDDAKCFCLLLSDIFDSLEQCVDEEEKALVQFLRSQIELLGKAKNTFRYPTDIIIFASLLFLISPHAYKFLRHTGFVLLPHPNTIRRICSKFNIGPQSEQTDANFLHYISQKSRFLSERDKVVALLLDEIHIKPFMDYKGGNIVGLAFDNKTMAKSAHVFMIQSIFSTFKDVVHILPVCTVTADTLYSMIRKIVIGLEETGLRVICLVTDNNAINRKAVSAFANPPALSIVYKHPMDNNRPLFYLLDPVHLLKSVRNNWLNKRNSNQCMNFPDIDDLTTTLTASFADLRALYNLESDKLLKHGYGLTLKALWPSNLERQNVKLVLQIFNKYIVQSLLELGPSHDMLHYAGTAKFVDLIYTWWIIVNVKSPVKGMRLRDEMQKPLTNDPDDPRIQYLRKFLNWLDHWKESNCAAEGFTKETHLGLTMTTHALIELTDYCTSDLGVEGINYILPGKFQTDVLEARFGQYRQMAGAQYHVSLRQVYEVEKKLRISSILSLPLLQKPLGEINWTNAEDLPNLESNELENNCTIGDVNFLNVYVEDADISKIENDIPVLTYLAGYCAYATLKKIKCQQCKEILVYDKEMQSDDASKLIQNLSRGGLLYPKQVVVNAVTYNYVVINKLTTFHESEFIQSSMPRNIALKLTVDSLSANELFDIEEHVCVNHHEFAKLLKLVIWASTNTLLKNYCKRKNDSQNIIKEKKGSNGSQTNLSKKRKLQTLLKD